MVLNKLLNKNAQPSQRVLAFTLRGAVTFVALALTVGMNTLPGSAAQSKQTENFRSFAQWCKNQASLSSNARRTVEALLQLADTTECDRGEVALSGRTSLWLSGKQIQDLSPLSGLTNLTRLNLRENAIADKTCPINPKSICQF